MKEGKLSCSGFFPNVSPYVINGRSSLQTAYTELYPVAAVSSSENLPQAEMLVTCPR